VRFTDEERELIEDRPTGEHAPIDLKLGAYPLPSLQPRHDQQASGSSLTMMACLVRIESVSPCLHNRSPSLSGASGRWEQKRSLRSRTFARPTITQKDPAGLDRKQRAH
jgi:hypothetical protein